jgi:SAM-dependent methyltransferase
MAEDNHAQIDYWNGKAGRTWAEAQERMDIMLRPVTEALLQQANVVPGMRVIDVGCGCGDTSLALAREGAQVWGIDISEPMLAVAKARARNLDNITFAQSDAAAQSFTADHDLVMSRFGVMFFADPEAAFSNLHSALNKGGSLCFVCWQPPRLNPWMAIAGKAVQPFLPAPETEPDPRAPGPFAFADRDYLHGILDQAGFADIQIESLTPTLHLADNLDDGMRFLQEIGPLARAIAELEDDPRDEALAAARESLSEHLGDTGLDLGAACWLVQAQANSG